MPIAVQCECGKKYQVGDDKAGKKLRCKACKGVLAVPAADSPPADEFDDFGDADFGAGGEFDDFGGDDFGSPAPAPRSNSGSQKSTGKKSKKGAKAKGKSGKKGGKKSGKSEMSPAVKYSLAGGIIVVAVAAVLGILYSRGVLGGGDKKSTSDSGGNVADGTTPPSGRTPSGGNPNNGKPGAGNPDENPAGVAILKTTEVKVLTPMDEPWVYTLSLAKLGGPIIASTKRNVKNSSGPASQTGNSNGQNPTVNVVADGQDPKAAARRAFATNNLKQIALAMHNYHEVHGKLPIPEKGGLSWRVHLLPFLEQNALFKQFKLDEPWDSDHNKALISQMPRQFSAPGTTKTGKTSFHILSGTGTPNKGMFLACDCRISLKAQEGRIEPEGKYELHIGFNRKRIISERFLMGEYRKTFLGKELLGIEPLDWKVRIKINDVVVASQIRFSDIRDGTSNTVMAVFAGPETEVEWTKPGGLNFDRQNPIASFGSVSEKGIPAVCFDGRAFSIPHDIDPDAFLRLAQHRDGKPVSITNLPRTGTKQPDGKTPTTPTGPQAIAAAQLLSRNPAGNNTNRGKKVRVTGKVTQMPQGWVFLHSMPGSGQRYVACKLAGPLEEPVVVGQTIVVEGVFTRNEQQYISLEQAKVEPTPSTPPGTKPPGTTQPGKSPPIRTQPPNGMPN